MSVRAKEKGERENQAFLIPLYELELCTIQAVTKEVDDTASFDLRRQKYKKRRKNEIEQPAAPIFT